MSEGLPPVPAGSLGRALGVRPGRPTGLRPGRGAPVSARLLGRSLGPGSRGRIPGSLVTRPPVQAATPGVVQAAPPPPAGATAASGQPGTGAEHTPLDSTYFANVVNEQFKTGNEINALNEQSGYARTDLQKALSAVTQKQPVDIENMRERYNDRGLLNSGHLGQALGQLGQSYADRMAALQSNFDRGQSARDARIAALKQAAALYGEEQGEAAAARASRTAAGDTSLGVNPPGDNQGGVTPIPAPVTPVTSTGGFRNGVPGPRAPVSVGALRGALGIRTQRVPGGAWHIYPNGHRVFVKGGR